MTTFHLYQPATWLRVAGSDAATFLQGQFTNELRGLGNPGVGGAVYGLWLNQKGRVLADSFVLRGAAVDEFWVGSYFSPAALIRERLEAYIIADDVIVTDETAGWQGASALTDGAVAAPAGAMAFRGRRTRAGGAEWMFPRAAAPQVRAALIAAGAREISAEEIERRRIAEGIPAVPADLGPGDLPNEGGLEADAISYTKGCYLGQEVMARLKAMGQVRRRLVPVRGSGAVPARPAVLFQGEKKIGELRSAVAEVDGVGWAGLAMLTLLHLDRAAPLALAPGAEAEVTLAGKEV